MFTIVLLILMIYFFYFGCNIYYDLFHRSKLDKDPNYFVQYEMDKPETSQREEILQKDFAGILKPNSPRLSKSPTAPLTNPRASSHSLLEKTIPSQIRNLTSSKFSRYARWREEAKRRKSEGAMVQEEMSRFHAEQPANVLDKLARKQRLDAVSRRVFENINRSRHGARKKQKESRPSESVESPKLSQAHEMPENGNLQPKSEVRSRAPKQVSAKKIAPSNLAVLVSEPGAVAHVDPGIDPKIPVGKGEKVEEQDTKARWRQLMNLAETSIVVERVDGIKVYKSTLFDSDTEIESD